jgi:hypothetical protein
MTITALAKTIRHLPAREQVKLFDKLGPTLEGYLLTKIAQDRFHKASHKGLPWEQLLASAKRRTVKKKAARKKG